MNIMKHKNIVNKINFMNSMIMSYMNIMKYKHTLTMSIKNMKRKGTWTRQWT
jgi:hypothetical protein